MIFYESPYRLVKALEQFQEYFGPDRKVSVSRELTKLFEENYRGTVTDALAHFKAKTVKGEIVIVVEGRLEMKLHEMSDED
jgi:16S rRNA (cytidine1402-2'-O)-methyltransferase